MLRNEAYDVANEYISANTEGITWIGISKEYPLSIIISISDFGKKKFILIETDVTGDLTFMNHTVEKPISANTYFSMKDSYHLFKNDSHPLHRSSLRKQMNKLY